LVNGGDWQETNVTDIVLGQAALISCMEGSYFWAMVFQKAAVSAP
jgi:hypothetical protein